MDISKNKIAKMIDHALLHPTLTDKQIAEGCELSKKYNVGSVFIKPYAIPIAINVLSGSDVQIGTVIGFPQGGNTTGVKAHEAEQVCKDGADELDMVVNIGKVLSEDWEYIKKDIKAVVDIARANNKIIKVIFETDFITEDSHKIKLCEICSELKVDFVKTSTGFGLIKGDDGKYSYTGATVHDIKLMRDNCPSEIGVKASGGITNLEDTLKMIELGATRIGTSSTPAILESAENPDGNIEY